MTAADPHGSVADRVRNCYAAWMNTPDAGRIRVRWFAVPDPPPGTYELSDYSSSNFDADELSYDPPAGEESSTRDPYRDWRDCCPPPWFGFRDDLCPTAVTPCAPTYRVPPLVLSGATVPEDSWPQQLMENTGPCTWASPTIMQGTTRYTATLFIQDDGSILVRLLLRPGIGLTNIGTYTAPGPVDMTQDLVLDNTTTGARPVFGPARLVVRPIPEDVLAVDDCTGITTGAGDFLLVT